MHGVFLAFVKKCQATNNTEDMNMTTSITVNSILKISEET